MGSLYVFRVMFREEGIFPRETGILISDDWVVRIVGHRILDCVHSLCALMSLIIESFDTSVSVDLIELRNKKGKPLHRLVARQSTVARAKRLVWWLLATLLAAVISGAVGAWIGIEMFGG